MKKIIIPILLVLFAACKEKRKKQEVPAEIVKGSVEIKDSIGEVGQEDPEPVLLSLNDVADTAFVRLRDYSKDFVYDMKYATKDNFLKTKVYDCAECYVRAKTARALMAANTELMGEGYRIKFFDCYRPHDVQKKMWKIVPNPQYVANPAKGSIHNKGGAVDITLVDMDGKEVDMGTGFDFFGKEAHHDYMEHPKEILQNRKLLKEIMEKHGFWGIRTEWWHYNLTSASNGKVANFRWDCE